MAHAQTPPWIGPTTTTTAPPAAEPPPAGQAAAQPSGDQLADGSDQAPAGAQDSGGDGAPVPRGGIPVPAEAQAIIDSVEITP